MRPRARLFFHPEAMKRRYAGGEGGVREIGLASVTEAELRKEEARLMWTTSPTEAAPGMWVTGEIPRRTDFEDTGGEFFLDPSCTKRDPIPDDQALWLDTGPGLIVLLGCAHAGVINTLRYIRRLTGRKIRAVIGGMHLIHAPERRLSLTLAALRDMDVRLLAPGHCTGERAVCGLKSGLPDRVSCCSAGMRWTFSEDGD
jgi:7,8-dihydropterin-6-yl-methyl-4-(beta-D-ribofuranosyl)aminobenzene 5'-phosphate synthase